MSVIVESNLSTSLDNFGTGQDVLVPLPYSDDDYVVIENDGWSMTGVHFLDINGDGIDFPEYSGGMGVLNHTERMISFGNDEDWIIIDIAETMDGVTVVAKGAETVEDSLVGNTYNSFTDQFVNSDIGVFQSNWLQKYLRY